MPQTFNVGSRSLFVTATAWFFILVAGAATASAVVQNAAVAALMPNLHVSAQGLPLVTGFLVGYLPWVVGAGLVISLATLVSAVGLLLRLEWARRVLIGLLAFAIVANLMGLWLQHELVQSFVSRAPVGPEAIGVFGGFVTATRVMAVAMTLAACAALAWVIRRLMSPSVKQEFA